MSDSVFVYINANISNALEELVGFCLAFQCNLLIEESCTFIRGGITYGDMYARDDIIFGPALTDAYMLEEKNAKVPRIIMRKKTLDYGKEGMDKTTHHFLDYCIFRDDDAFYTLDYFKALFDGSMHKNVVERDAIERVDATISHWLDTTIDESIRPKYLYVDKHFRKYMKEKTDD